MVFARQSECLRTTHSHQNFKSLVPRKITQHTGIVWVIFDNQQDCIIGLQIVAVVRNLLDRMFRDDGQGRWRHRRWILSLHHGSARRAHIGLWQVEDEGAPLTGSAPQLDFSTEEAGQFAADRQPQTCSTVLTAGGRVCLLESRRDDAPRVLRLGLASAFWKACKIIRCLSNVIPMPVSATSKATTDPAFPRMG